MKYKLIIAALLLPTFVIAQPATPSANQQVGAAAPGGAQASQPGASNAGYQGTMSAKGGLGAAKPSASSSDSSVKGSQDSGHYNPNNCPKTPGNVC
jgi:hypothetical protein